MNKPVLLAAMVAALPLGAGAQQERPDAARAEAPRASSALPARASTRPEPQLGTVAPNTRVPSHTLTPSLRAMRAATAKEEARTAGRAATDCAPAVAQDDVEQD